MNNDAHLCHFSDHELFVLCHGYQGSVDEPFLTNLQKSLSGKKLSSLRFGFYGANDIKTLSLKNMAAELTTVINHFPKYRKIYLVGGSLGIQPILLVANHKRVTGLISVNGFFLGKIKKPEFRRAFAFAKIARFVIPRIKKEWNFLMENGSPEKIKKPMLIIASESDEVIDYTQSLNFAGKLKCPHQVKLLPLSGHAPGSPDDCRLIAEIISKWTKKTSSI
jgi:predicted alpha/beta hydrolase family esterase